MFKEFVRNAKCLVLSATGRVDSRQMYGRNDYEGETTINGKQPKM
jgi:hypothetical protein